MYISRLAFCIIFALISALVSPPGLAAATPADSTLLFYDFDDTAGNFDLNPEVVADGLRVGDWSDLRGTLTDFSGNPGRALAARGFDLGNALLLPLTVEPGYRLEIDSFSFDQLSSSSGPQTWAFAIDDAAVGGGATTPAFSLVSGSVDGDPLYGDLLMAITGAAASSARGTFRVDNFRLSGSVHAVPLPAPLILLLSGLMPLVVRR